MSELIIDAEVFCEIDLPKAGVYEYANHPSMRPILWAARSRDWDASLVFEEGDIWDVLRMLKKANRIKWTKNDPLLLVHWGAFDREIIYQPMQDKSDWDFDEEGCIGGPTNTYWCDAQQLSLIYGGPPKLADAAPFFGDGTRKQTGGKALINRFCKPQADGSVITAEDDPVRWAQFRSYAGFDVDAVAPMMDRFEHLAENGGEDLLKHWPHMQMIERMNKLGVGVDRDAANVAEGLINGLADRQDAFVKAEYGFSTGAVAKVREFLGTDDCQRETLEGYLDGEHYETDEQRVLCEARLLTSGAAVKKVTSMLMRSNVDGRVHDAFRYHGAWTRRLTSSGVQLQNMLRHVVDDAFFNDLYLGGGKYTEDIFAQVRKNIRGFLLAHPGMVLCASDYNAIECRVAAWLAGEKWLLDMFRKGGDPYLRMASSIHSELITDKSDPRRQFGKTVELGSQYQLGGQGLFNQCEQKKIEVTLSEAKHAIAVYRDTHPAIVECWADCERAWQNLMSEDTLGQVIMVGVIKFERIENAIKVIRPSGFAQYYWMPRWAKGEWPNGDLKWDMCYTGRSPLSGQMTARTTYGGDIFQGVTQGVACDVMLEGMERVEAAGYPLVMTVHDEVVTEIENDGYDYVDEVSEVLCEPIAWADGLPLAAEGWQQSRFTKG